MVARRAHSISLATAFSAAAAIALPPRRPRTMTLGTSPLASSASLDSAAPTKPTGMPITAAGGVDAGLLQDFEQAKQRGRRVADHHDRSRQLLAPQLHRRRGARGAELGGERRHARIGQRADHGIVGRQPRSRNAMGHHLGIAKNRRAGAQRRRGSGAEPSREHDVVGDIDHAAGMDDPHRDLFIAGIETVELAPRRG